jgi:hypothetical protein
MSPKTDSKAVAQAAIVVGTFAICVAALESPLPIMMLESWTIGAGLSMAYTTVEGGNGMISAKRPNRNYVDNRTETRPAR